jgi:hypothetical protein
VDVGDALPEVLLVVSLQPVMDADYLVNILHLPVVWNLYSLEPSVISTAVSGGSAMMQV